jgi:predicted TIM-barrel fold metal-dependent hydrolase
MLCDAHVHFFSPTFFATLAGQRQIATADALRHLGWEDPVSAEALADRWVAELDAQGVARAAIIASVPGDESSVAAAVDRHPARFVGYFMLDPTRDDAENRVVSALGRGLRGVCLFPAMQGYSLHDERVMRIADVLAAFGPSPRAAGRGPVLFVHCGVLSVGARQKLGLPSPFDIRYGNPLDLAPLAMRHPEVPIVIPHFGAGMLREALMLADQCASVHFDTSSSNRWVKYQPGLTLERVFESALAVVGAERLLFGTDSSFFPRGWHRAIYNQQRTALVDIGASETQQAAIFSGNFERLFALP